MIGAVTRETEEHMIEGVLHCSHAACQREFPILDGIPLIIADLRRYVSDNILAMVGRRDMTELTESLLGDCCGPGSTFDQLRQQLSFYAWDHYADLDPQESMDDPRPGSMLRCLDAGRQLAQPIVSGPMLDVGCSVGRGTFALAEQTTELVLGIDLNFGMLRLAAEVLRTGTVRYPRRRVGVVYECRQFSASFPNTANVDFWACDATALPFPDNRFSLAVSMNVLDCVANPIGLLNSIARVLHRDGKGLLTCPYDWSPAATPLESWLGGHSQRSPSAGASEAVLHTLLAPCSNSPPVAGLELIAEQSHLPWHVRLHDRSTMNYLVHLLVAQPVVSENPSSRWDR
ncbi:MAG: methyltransferase domain-containing protein [Planctomycetaceae bacterium]|nr:MAG: methyltransferase domain-containing protein [Planctomycetaceae bacterium]